MKYQSCISCHSKVNANIKPLYLCVILCLQALSISTCLQKCRLAKLTLYQTIPNFNPFQNKPWFLRVCSKIALKTLCEKEIAHNEQFLLFPQCFLPIWRTICRFCQFRNCRLQIPSIWKSVKFVVWERETSEETSFENVMGKRGVLATIILFLSTLFSTLFHDKSGNLSHI